MQIVDIRYNPNKSQAAFHRSESMYKAMVGALGSGKSSTLCVEGVTLSLEHNHNIGLVTRKTLPELHSTTMKRFFEYVPEPLIVSFNQTKRELVIRNNVGGTSTVLFGPLDQINRYKSLEIGWFGIDEADETSEDHWLTLCGRLRLKNVPLRAMLATNPTSKTHWIYKRWVEQKLEGYELFRSKTSDNLENLPPGYVEQLRNNYSKDWQQRYLDGEFGVLLKSDPVFPEFNDADHVKTLEPNQRLPIIRGWDFGLRHPCVVWAQISDTGVFHWLRTYLGENEDLYSFSDTVIRLSNKWYNTYNFIDFCDPAGTHRKDTGKPSVEVLKEKGIIAGYRRSTPGERATEIRRMMRERKFLVDPCNQYAIEALQGGYQVNEAGEPRKDGYFEHGMDAMGYIISNEIMTRREDLGELDIIEPKWTVRKG